MTLGRLLIGFEDDEVDGWYAATTDRYGNCVFAFEVLMLYDAIIAYVTQYQYAINTLSSLPRRWCISEF